MNTSLDKTLNSSTETAPSARPVSVKATKQIRVFAYHKPTADEIAWVLSKDRVTTAMTVRWCEERVLPFIRAFRHLKLGIWAKEVRALKTRLYRRIKTKPYVPRDVNLTEIQVEALCWRQLIGAMGCKPFRKREDITQNQYIIEVIAQAIGKVPEIPYAWQLERTPVVLRGVVENTETPETEEAA